MPQAKKTATSASRSKSQFKEPAALKRLSKSLDSAHDALSQLQSQTGSDVSKTARDIYKDLKSFVSSARRDSGKFAKTLQRDFDDLQKRVTKSAGHRASASGTRAKSSASSRAKTTAARAKATTGKRTATKRTAAKRTTTATKRTATKRATSAGGARSARKA